VVECHAAYDIPDSQDEDDSQQQQCSCEQNTTSGTSRNNLDVPDYMYTTYARGICYVAADGLGLCDSIHRVASNYLRLAHWH